LPLPTLNVGANPLQESLLVRRERFACPRLARELPETFDVRRLLTATWERQNEQRAHGSHKRAWQLAWKNAFHV
jgi:hypothetical protein